MGYNEDLENAVRRIIVEAYPTGEDNPLNTVYKPTDTISDETWKKMKHGYFIQFTILPNINERVVSGYLDMLWDNWKRGGYKCSEDFINVVDDLMENLRKVQASRNKLTFMDEALYDELLEGFEKVINQRTWNNSITDKMLKDKAIEIQTDIEIYLKKRVEHNLDITDKMNSFKGVEDLTDATTERITSFMKKANEVFEEEESKPTEPILDFATGWECALAMRQKIVNGDLGRPVEDVAINDGYRWAGENCTIDGEKVKWKNLIKDYSNAKERTKAGEIIADFERKYYKKSKKSKKK